MILKLCSVQSFTLNIPPTHRWNGGILWNHRPFWVNLSGHYAGEAFPGGCFKRTLRSNVQSKY